MKSKLVTFSALGFLFAAFVLWAVPARAESVDDQIQALKQQLARLEAEQAQANREQIELKREATAAAAALPTFTYRPGRGATVEAADRSWSFNMTYELMTVMYNHLDGNDRRGATVGDLHNRRNRPYWIFCANNCFYNWGIGLDIDTGTKFTNGIEQSQWFRVGFNRINPFLPELHVGDAASGPYGGQVGVTPAGERSSTSSGVLESAFDLLSDSATHMLSRRGIQLNWKTIPLGMGDTTFAVDYKLPTNFQDNSVASVKTADTDRKAFQLSLLLRPFSRSKDFWTRGLRLGTGFQTVSIDSRSSQGRAMTLKSGYERVGGQTIRSVSSIGDGTHWAFSPGMDWTLGPYKAAWAGRWSRYEGKNDDHRGVRGHYWRVWHELFLWSPKGPFTGSAATFGSVQLGQGFTRADIKFGDDAEHLTNHELGLYYYIRSAMRVGVNWYFWRSSNTPVGVQQAIGCTTRATDAGKECDWHTINLVLNANF